MNISGLQIAALVIIGIILVLAVIRSYIVLQAFLRELRYLNNEINRTEGREREHYIRRKKRLLLSIIPFVRY